MSFNQERLYGLVVRMHPAAFREEYGPEMEMDFADALRDGRAAALYWDGLVSVGRQWFFYGAVGQPAAQVASGPNLLSGRYGAVDEDRLTAWEWLRGLAGSLGLIAILVLAPTRVGKSSLQPANAVGARGTTAAGTRSMSRGGDDAGMAQVKRVEQAAPGSRAATAAEMSQSPGEVSAATAAALSGVPGQGAAAVVVTGKREFRAFDVASVKESRNGGDGNTNFPLGPSDLGYGKPGGVFRATNESLGLYIAFAYKLNSYQNSQIRAQLPGWALATRYDIEARVDGEPTKDEMRVMMQALLAERFHLKVHTEERDAAVFHLELVKPGKVGPGVVAHAVDDPKCEAGAKPAYFSPCGAMGVTPTPEIKVSGRKVTMAEFADFSGTPAGRPVIDRTGLTGTWDITVDFGLDSAPKVDARPEETAPTFAQAVREQMGMKLEPGRAKVDVYVVDGVERPSGN